MLKTLGKIAITAAVATVAVWTIDQFNKKDENPVTKQASFIMSVTVADGFTYKVMREVNGDYLSVRPGMSIVPEGRDTLEGLINALKFVNTQYQEHIDSCEVTEGWEKILELAGRVKKNAKGEMVVNLMGEDIIIKGNDYWVGDTKCTVEPKDHISTLMLLK